MALVVTPGPFDAGFQQSPTLGRPNVPPARSELERRRRLELLDLLRDKSQMVPEAVRKILLEGEPIERRLVMRRRYDPEAGLIGIVLYLCRIERRDPVCDLRYRAAADLAARAPKYWSRAAISAAAPGFERPQTAAEAEAERQALMLQLRAEGCLDLVVATFQVEEPWVIPYFTQARARENEPEAILSTVRAVRRVRKRYGALRDQLPAMLAERRVRENVRRAQQGRALGAARMSRLRAGSRDVGAVAAAAPTSFLLSRSLAGGA